MLLDLRRESLDWSAARLDRTMFLGCLLPDGAADRLAASGAGVFPGLDDLPFAAYRAELYTYDELMAADADAGLTLDARIAVVVRVIVDLGARRRDHARCTTRRWMPQSRGSSPAAASSA